MKRVAMLLRDSTILLAILLPGHFCQFVPKTDMHLYPELFVQANSEVGRLRGTSAYANRENRREAPKMPKHENGSLSVYYGLYIESMGNFKATEMTYEMDLFLLSSWSDPDKAHNGTIISVNDKSELSNYWLPDVFFANAKTAYFQSVTVPNFVLWIHGNGMISYSVRVTLTLACNLELADYPLDVQICKLKLMSYGYTSDQMNVTWFSENAIGYNREITLPQFQIESLDPGYCDGNHKYAITQHGYRRGNFGCLLVEIWLHRAIGYHLVQTYIPTSLIVCISWVGFWIDRYAVPARVSLSFTTLLTLTTMGAGLRFSLPPVSYAKAIDFWYGACLLFVFGALIEFAMVNSFVRKSGRYQDLSHGGHCSFTRPWCVKGKRSKLTKSRSCQNCFDQSGSAVFTAEVYLDSKSDEYSKRALHIDQYARCLFPLVFAIFCFVYACYYGFRARR